MKSRRRSSSRERRERPNNECIRMNGSGTTPATLTARSVVMTCNGTKYIGTGNYTAAQVATAFGSGQNNNNDGFTSTLTSLFINGTNETGSRAYTVTIDPAPPAQPASVGGRLDGSARVLTPAGGKYDLKARKVLE